MRVAWHLRDAYAQLWRDGDLERLRAWVAIRNATFGVLLGRGPEPFRSEEPGYGYPVPAEFRR